MKIEYHHNPAITADQFISLLKRSTLGERRPIDDLPTIQGMIDNASILITATVGNQIIGIARAVTDVTYCCYVSDLAVDREYQRCGIGRQLLNHIENHLKSPCKIVLLAAPKAAGYYPKLGFTQHPSAWVKDKEPH